MRHTQSIRFKLSVQYSAVVFGLGGAILGLVYLAIQRGLRSQTMMAHVQTGQRVVLADGQVVIMPEFKEIEVRALESIYSEVVLNRVAQFTILAVGLLFLLSLIVGWVMSGRVLKPVEEITNVAMDIEASDLSRRIDLCPVATPAVGGDGLPEGCAGGPEARVLQHLHVGGQGRAGAVERLTERVGTAEAAAPQPHQQRWQPHLVEQIDDALGQLGPRRLLVDPERAPDDVLYELSGIE